MVTAFGPRLVKTPSDSTPTMSIGISEPSLLILLAASIEATQLSGQSISELKAILRFPSASIERALTVGSGLAKARAVSVGSNATIATG